MISYKLARNDSYENYRKNGVISHVIFFFLILLAAAFTLIGIFFVDILFIVVPLIVFPLIFASEVIVILLRDQSQLTFGGFMRTFSIYFTSRFRSNFKVIINFLWSLIAYVASTFVLLIVINLCFYYCNYKNYAYIYELIYNNLGGSYQAIYNILEGHLDFLNDILLFTEVPALFVASILFFYLTTKHSVSLFMRLSAFGGAGNVITYLHRRIMKKYRKEYTSLFIKLNWPLFVLYIIGFIGGAVIAYYLYFGYGGVFSMALALGIFMSFGLYGPFLLANNEAIYKAFEPCYLEENEAFLKQFQVNLEAMLKSLEKTEEATKKDSDESNS